MAKRYSDWLTQEEPGDEVSDLQPSRDPAGGATKVPTVDVEAPINHEPIDVDPEANRRVMDFIRRYLGGAK